MLPTLYSETLVFSSEKWYFIRKGVIFLEYTDLNALKTACLSCEKCPLARTRQNVVFGMGVENAEIMFIGEGPGANEDKEGFPFVGAAGHLLDTMLDAVGLSRERNVYIANIVKCRPPQNRDPDPAEQDACIGWLKAQVGILRPKIIVCLGRIAAQKIIHPDFRVTRQHGEFSERKGVYLMGTYHPAALLRNPAQKPDAFADFLKLRDLVPTVCEHTVIEEEYL